MALPDQISGLTASEDVGIGPLCEMLRKHTPLKSLNLRFNGLKDWWIKRALRVADLSCWESDAALMSSRS